MRSRAVAQAAARHSRLESETEKPDGWGSRHAGRRRDPKEKFEFCEGEGAWTSSGFNQHLSNVSYLIHTS